MAYIVSPALGMNLADPTTIQTFETPVVNANFMALENGLVADRVRLTSLEALPPALATPTLYARGQLADYLVVDATALTAVATASIGDTAFVTTPGLGVNPFVAVAVADTGTGLDWRIRGRVVADTKAHLDSFIDAWNNDADLLFEVGGRAFVTGTGIGYIFSSATGGLLLESSRVRMKPTLMSAGGTISDTGYMTSTAQSTIRFDGGFTDACDIYEVHYDFTINNAVQLLAQLTKATVAAATLYDNLRWRVQNSVGSAAAPAVATTSILMSDGLSLAASRHVGVLRLVNPKVVAPTLFKVEQSMQTIPIVAATSAMSKDEGNHGTADTYDGVLFSLSAGGTITVNSMFVEGVPK